MKKLRNIVFGAAFVMLLYMPGFAFASTNLTVRLVAVSSVAAQHDPKLADVEDILKRNLPFASYRLLESETISIPANNEFALRRFKIRCVGPSESLQVSIRRHGKPLISTIVSLNGGTPVFLGGFTMRDEKNSKAVFILTQSEQNADIR